MHLHYFFTAYNTVEWEIEFNALSFLCVAYSVAGSYCCWWCCMNTNWNLHFYPLQCRQHPSLSSPTILILTHLRFVGWFLTWRRSTNKNDHSGHIWFDNGQHHTISFFAFWAVSTNKITYSYGEIIALKLCSVFYAYAVNSSCTPFACTTNEKLPLQLYERTGMHANNIAPQRCNDGKTVKLHE